MRFPGLTNRNYYWYNQYNHRFRIMDSAVKQEDLAYFNHLLWLQDRDQQKIFYESTVNAMILQDEHETWHYFIYTGLRGEFDIAPRTPNKDEIAWLKTIDPYAPYHGPTYREWLKNQGTKPTR